MNNSKGGIYDKDVIKILYLHIIYLYLIYFNPKYCFN